MRSRSFNSLTTFGKKEFNILGIFWKLAQVIIKILEDGDLQKRMGSEERKRAKKLFLWNLKAKKYFRLFEEVVHCYRNILRAQTLQDNLIKEIDIMHGFLKIE